MSEYLGYDDLENTERRQNFNNWLYEEIFPAIKGDILEIGSGIGTYSEKIICDFPNSEIALSDFSQTYVKNLEKRFDKNITFYKLDLNLKSDYDKIGYEKFDTIVGVNVLDNVENDEFALQQLYKMLKKNGMLVLLLPAHKSLFSQLDRNIGRLRRYSKTELKSKISKTDFEIVKMFYFNAIGIIGWYLNGKSGKTPKLSDNAFKTYDKMIPITKFIEKMTGRKVGLSIICYLKKNPKE